MLDQPPEKRATQSEFCKRQLFVKSPVILPSEVDLAGKTAIITGSSTGISLESSRQLLDLGLSRLILAVWSDSKGDAARKIIACGEVAGKHTIEV